MRSLRTVRTTDSPLIFVLNKKPFTHKIEHGIPDVDDGKTLAKRIAWIAVPIIIGSEIMPIMTVIDTGIVMNVLQANGWSRSVTEHLYGLYGGYCNSIIALDRKSTRLNSSHVCISYAVFCLKKKIT